MTSSMNDLPTERIDAALQDLDLRSNSEILHTLLDSQQQALDAVRLAIEKMDEAIHKAAFRLGESSQGRLVMVGAGASGRLAVQDGAELWPTFGWPHERLLCCMAGGPDALVKSIEGVEDDAAAAQALVAEYGISDSDVVIAVAASGRSPWTCTWLEDASKAGALCIAMANNRNTRLLELAECPLLLDTGAEVLAGSTRMAAGTAQKIALNLFSTALMIRLNRTYGNLMVDMAAVNTKLDQRRIRMLKSILPALSDQQASVAVQQANGWVKLAALIASGDSPDQARLRLDQHAGSLRSALLSIHQQSKP
ncbi:MAG: N-acetylmuramic acid 6-phosphate etherase [Granulosicoccus sp.]